jgi:hypothetical protein
MSVAVSRNVSVWVSLAAVGCTLSACAGLEAPDAVTLSGDRSVYCPARLSACHGSCVDMSSDVASCGACDNACSIAPPSTVACVSGRCEATLVSGQNEPHWVFANGGKVYWDALSEVSAVPSGGGWAQTVVADQGQILGLTLSAGAMYWDSVPFGCIEELPPGASEPITIAGLGGTDFVAADSSAAYWTDASSGTVQSVPASAGQPRTLATGRTGPYGLAVDDQYVYWADTPFENDALTQGSLLRVPKTGGQIVTLATSPEPYFLLVAKGWLYWSDLGGFVLRVPSAGGSVETIADNQLAPAALATDGLSLYWTEVGTPHGTPGSIVRWSLAGGQPATLVADTHSPLGIAVDDASVYWTAASTGSVMKLTPK